MRGSSAPMARAASLVSLRRRLTSAGLEARGAWCGCGKDRGGAPRGLSGDRSSALTQVAARPSGPSLVLGKCLGGGWRPLVPGKRPVWWFVARAGGGGGGARAAAAS